MFSCNKIAAPWTCHTAQPRGINPKMLPALPLPSATDDTCTSTFHTPLLRCISGFASSTQSYVENKNAKCKTKDAELVNVPLQQCVCVCVCDASHLHTSVDTCTKMHQVSRYAKICQAVQVPALPGAAASEAGRLGIAHPVTAKRTTMENTAKEGGR